MNSPYVEVRTGQTYGDLDLSDSPLWESTFDGLDTDLIVLKPNWIAERRLSNDEWEQVITHGSVLRAVARAVGPFLKKGATLVLADAPQGDSNIERIQELVGVASLREEMQREFGVELEVVDLRSERWDVRDGVVFARHQLAGDPRGATMVNLGERSRFAGVSGRRYYGADYDVAETNRHHSGTTHEYSFSRTVLEAGLVINLPKMKTHKKAGVTLSLKNVVGVNTNKNLLPHYSLSRPWRQGDQFDGNGAKQWTESVGLSTAKAILRRLPLLGRVGRVGKSIGTSIFGETQYVVRSGNWHGNDTIWRMILDLNAVLRFATPTGEVKSSPQRRVVSVVDGITAGEGNGPENPDARPLGVVVLGDDSVSVDIGCTRLMGLDWRRVPHLKHAVEDHILPLTTVGPGDVVANSADPTVADSAVTDLPAVGEPFRPHFGWVGMIEREPVIA